MVIDDFMRYRYKRMSARAADFATKHCGWFMLERGRTENTHLAKACSLGAIANRVPCRLNLLSPP